MRREREPEPLESFSVEIETEGIDDLSVPLPAICDRIAHDLSQHEHAIDVHAGTSQVDRTIFVRATVRGVSAQAALALVSHAVDESARHHQRDAVRIRRLSAAPEAHPAALATTHVAWPPQFVAQRPNAVASTHSAFDTARTFASAHALARDFRGAGDNDLARSIERWLQPGLSTLEALHGLRNCLMSLRGTHSPMVNNVEGTLDRLIVSVNHQVAAMRERR